MTIKQQLRYSAGMQTVSCEHCTGTIEVNVSEQYRGPRRLLLRSYSAYCPHCRVAYAGIIANPNNGEEP